MSDVVKTEGENGVPADEQPDPHPQTPTQTQHLWATLLVEEFVRHGVGLFVLAPGSRCTPLILAVAENPRAKHLMHFDERGGAFAALGYARATGKPAVWITTSGTAVSNGFSAVIEADADRVPLILLTADRPAELRETGSNQTIRQPGIFGGYVRWQVDLPVPDPAIDPAFMLTTAAQAVHRSLSPSGPVHINCMFREPLAPEELKRAELPSSLHAWQSQGTPYTRYSASCPLVAAGEFENLAGRLEGIDRGLVVLGKSDATAHVEAATKLAEALGWPLLADVASGGRLGGTKSLPTDLLPRSVRFREANRPDAILHLGGEVASKRLQQFIEQARPAAYTVVRPDAVRYDPGHLVTDRLQSDVVGFSEAMCAELVPPSRPSAWMHTWTRASAAAEEAIERALNTNDLSEPAVARTISKETPEGHGLVVASSLPIRNMDAFAANNGSRLRVTANRGASGIDGTVATTAGFARGLSQPATLLIGDLALLHDLNSLALLSNGPPVTVVVINNDGGGIFNFLPIAQQKGVFEPYFGTPHGLSFENAARQFEIGYERPSGMDAFISIYANATTGEASSIIEVCTDRGGNVAMHDALIEAVVEAIDGTLGL